MIISEFIVDNKSKDRCVYEISSGCSCHECVPQHTQYYYDDENDFDHSDYDDDCNGYCNDY